MVKKLVFPIVLVITILALLVSLSYAWFFISYRVEPEVSGDAVTGYFKSGSGTKEDPYIIETATHVYNLAWLQYIGLLNQKQTDENGKTTITQFYFAISEEIDEIDMAGVVIPPIGRLEHPFVGHFDGNGRCISNLTVSNYLADGNDEFGIEKRPLSITSIDGSSVSIVGFFGVVGALDADMKAMLADDSKIENISEKVNSVHDLFLDNFTVRTETDRSLIGLLAGYVNGSVENIGIGESNIVIGTGVLPLSSQDAFDMQRTVSMYSLIGKYDINGVDWVDKPTGGNDGENDNDAPGAGWGGSINMLELRKRVKYITGAGGLSGSGQNYYVDAFDYYGWFSAKSQYYVDYTTRSSRAVFLDGTVMPLSIDQTIFDKDEMDSANGLKTLPYYEDNKALNKEPVLTTNSGYIVGGGNKTNSTDTSYINFVPEYPLGYDNWNGWGIYKSLKEAGATRGAFPENNNSFVMHMLTIDANGDTYVIQDSYNTNNGVNRSGTYYSKNASNYSFAAYDSDVLNFQKYIQINTETGVDTGVRTSFVNNNAGESLIQGISFNNTINPNSIETTEATVTLFGNEKNDYELIKGAINFSLKEDGISTTILGTYRYSENYNSTTGANLQGLYTIFKVERTANNEISTVTVIDTIHENLSPAEGEKRYVYNIGSNYDKEKYSLVYHRENMSKLTEANALYYFEIPLNAGDYAIGATAAEGAYLLYLDIGANGDKSSDGGNNGTGTTQVHKISGITFVDSTAIENKSTSGYSVVTFSVDIAQNVTSHNGLSLSFGRSSPTLMTCVEKDASSVFTVGVIKDDNELTVTHTVAAATAYALPPGLYARKERYA